MKYLLFVVFFNPEKLTSSPDYAWIIFYFNKKKWNANANMNQMLTLWTNIHNIRQFIGYQTCNEVAHVTNEI